MATNAGERRYDCHDRNYYNPPRCSYIKMPPEKLDYFLVLDFEANRYGQHCPRVKEIIEFAVLKMNVQTLEVEEIFHHYVQPTITPVIDPFITELTGITQDKVDDQLTLPEVLKEFREGVKSCFVTCSNWDFKKALPINCD